MDQRARSGRSGRVASRDGSDVWSFVEVGMRVQWTGITGRDGSPLGTPAGNSGHGSWLPRGPRVRQCTRRPRRTRRSGRRVREPVGGRSPGTSAYDGARRRRRHRGTQA